VLRSRFFLRSANGPISAVLRRGRRDACHPTQVRGSFRTCRKGRAPVQGSLCTSEGGRYASYSQTRVLCGAQVSAQHHITLPYLPLFSPPPPAPHAAADHVRCPPPPGLLGSRWPRRRLLHVLRRELGEFLRQALSRTGFAEQLLFSRWQPPLRYKN